MLRREKTAGEKEEEEDWRIEIESGRTGGETGARRRQDPISL
jgi:hypothetical protein